MKWLVYIRPKNLGSDWRRMQPQSLFEADSRLDAIHQSTGVSFGNKKLYRLSYGTRVDPVTWNGGASEAYAELLRE